MALTIDSIVLFQNAAHTKRICDISEECCGIKRQVRIDLSSWICRLAAACGVEPGAGERLSAAHLMVSLICPYFTITDS